jgi:hypothetical protein
MPQIAFGKPTNLTGVLNALELRTVSITGIAADYVYIALDTKDFEESGGDADTFVVLKIPGGVVRPGDFAGGGGEVTSIDCQLQAEIWNRYEVDQGPRDKKALTDATLGLLSKFQALLSGLQGWYPNAANESIFEEPMRLIRFDVVPRPPQHGWLRMNSQWALTYRQQI